MVYEIQNPSAYVVPDVCCDWTNVKCENLNSKQVKVTGARGDANVPTYKVCNIALNPSVQQVSLLLCIVRED